MPQNTHRGLPLFLNMDKPFSAQKEEDQISSIESPYFSGFSWDINANPEIGFGMNNAIQEGQNLFVLTPTRSNKEVPNTLKPDGYCLTIGVFESKVTNELYYHVFNSNLNHFIAVLDGNTGAWYKVIQDPELEFTDDPEGKVFNRSILRYVKDKEGNITEKHYCWTDGKKWQGWINVIAAIGSNGFDAALYPYWKVLPPQFDRRELLEWAVRPPMIKAVVSTIANTTADVGKINRLIDKAFQVGYAFRYTDGRTTTLSPYSLPLIVKSEEFLNNPDALPKNALFRLYAGSPMVESVLIFIRKAGAKNVLDPTAVWGDWILYDTIYKFTENPTGEYWKRINPWSSFNYDAIFNTVDYVFDNSKVGRIVSPEDTTMLQTGIPQISIACSDLEDGALLSDNRYNYDNFSKSLIDKVSAIVKEKILIACNPPLRKIKLYCYVGRERPNNAGSDEPRIRDVWLSQVGYKNGTDLQPRFGGMAYTSDAEVRMDVDESKYFQLDFADREGFRCYLKGTPFYADAKWYQVKQDFTLVKIDDLLDAAEASDLTFIENVFGSKGFFVGVFEFNVPAGRYIATIGRHNVANSGDYRGQSTYILGVANSRLASPKKFVTDHNRFVTVTTMTNSTVQTYSKEMELDCVAADLDVWGNGRDIFYIVCPFDGLSKGNSRWTFLEGCLREDATSNIPIELFPYGITYTQGGETGRNTDKNGFYFGYTWGDDTRNNEANIYIKAKVNCAYPFQFIIQVNNSGSDSGWRSNNKTFLNDFNGGVVGDCNRILYKGKVTDLTGLLPYSNIAISIKDGETVFTASDGAFTMIVHNGQPLPRLSNVYVNAGGSFLITLDNCGYLMPTVFDENLIQCINCQVRNYPIPLVLKVNIPNSSETSLKQGGKYSVGLVGADLAGRMMNVNVVKEIEVQTFLQRNDLAATYIQLLITAALQLTQENPDIRWISPYVSKNVNLKRYVEWTGDNIKYLDQNGNVTTDVATAVFTSISIQSLYDANVTNNFSLLANYQFVKQDRVRFYDNGEGQLFDNATYGGTIDVQVLGTNYNQAAINAGLQLPQTNVVLDNNNVTSNNDISLIVRYDSRLDKLFDKTGFWIEIYTPTQEAEELPFFEVAGFYPIINGEIAEFVGYTNGVPTYNYPTTIDLQFWDTYFLQRNISGKFTGHPFESPNVTDNWGANITSGGRLGVENKNAKQIWLGGDTAASDGFLRNNNVNGLAIFRAINRKNYGIYPFGEIRLSITRRNIIAFICANDYFVVGYKMPYPTVGENGYLIANRNDGLTEPYPKTGAMYGIEKTDFSACVVDEDFFFWYDSKNTALVKCDYQNAIDISQQTADERGGIQAYLNTKISAINKWNLEYQTRDRFDVLMGIDEERGNIYLTFRPRRNNSNDPTSYINQRRNTYLLHQETLMYSTQYKGWLPCQNFCGEAYGRLRGNFANVEFLAFAAGTPYYHNNTPNDSFLNFFGIQTEPTIVCVMNKNPEIVKILQAISQDINGSFLYADLIYDTQQNSYSYIPANYWKEKEKNRYAEVLRNMMSYPNPDPDQLFRSMILDGKRIFSNYMLVRFVQVYPDLGKYFQLSGINYLFTNSVSVKP